MRGAILFSPLAFESGSRESATHGERAAWLRRALSLYGYEVTHAGGVDALGQLTRAARGVADGGDESSLLVHVSATFKRKASLALPGGGTLAIAELARALNGAAGRVMVIAELGAAGDSEDALGLAEDVADLRAAFAAEAPLLTFLASLAPEAVAADLPFTRLVLRVASELLDDGRERVLASELYDRIHELPESEAGGSHALLRGAHDFEIALPTDEVEGAPDVELLFDLAHEAEEAGSLPHALAGYRAALLAKPEGALRARVYASIAGAERALGHAGRARRCYQKALEADPRDRRSLDVLIELETEAGRWPKVAEAMRARALLLDSPAEKVDELFSLARLTVEKLRDVQGAVAHLEAARRIDAGHEDVLEALRRLYRLLGRWDELIEVTGALAERAPTATERAARRFAQAQVARKHTEDASRAAGFLRAALEADPTHDEALDVLCEVLSGSKHKRELEGELTVLLERLFEMEDEERALDVAKRLAALRDEAKARTESTSEVAAEDIESVDEDEASSLEELQAQATAAPLVAATHAALFANHRRAGRFDRAYLSALALEELGALTPEVEAVLDAQRLETPSVRAPLDDEAWIVLRAPGSDDVLEALVRAIGRPAALVRYAERKARGRAVILDEARRQDGSSSAPIVRTLRRASDALGVDCPALYLLDRVPGDLLAIPSDEARTAIGPTVQRLSSVELAFLAGRHLTYYRPEHKTLIDFPTRNEMSLLLLAALQVALPQMPVPGSVEGTVSSLRAGLAEHLTEDEREALCAAVARLDARGGRVNLQAWIRSVELTAARAGLLLCGDLRAATSRLRNEARAVAELSVEEKRTDLLAFCASAGFATLRERFSRPSDRPAPRQSGMMGKAPPRLVLADEVEEEIEVEPETAEFESRAS